MYKPERFTDHKMPYRFKALERDIILFNWKSEERLPLNPEFWVTTFGSLGYLIKEKRWVHGTFNGILDEYGDFTTYVCHSLNTENVQTYTVKNHEEVIVCGNTPLYRPFEMERDFFSFMKGETDRSILCQLINTRFNKAIIAMNDPQKKQIIQAYKDVVDGLPLVLVTSILEDLNTLDLTDPSEVDKIQYLTSFYQSMEKREANNSGIDLDNLDKRAQVSTEEIKQYDDVTTIDYLIMYEMRKRFVKEMKENGIDIDIVPNPVFYDEPDNEDIDNGTFEAAEEDQETIDNTEQEESNNEENN